MLIAIDSNVFIAALSSNEEHSPNAQQLIRDIAVGKHTAVASSIVYGEVLGISNANRSQDMEDFFSHIDNLATLPVDDDICITAGKLRRDHGSKLKLPDAIHLATALSTNANLLITNDIVLAKVAQKLLPTKLLSEYSI
jgi:predicted nucleic acid-binding protein